MAKAKTTTKTKKTVVLKLSGGEVDFLASVLRRVGGDPHRSPRRYERSILDALVDGAELDVNTLKADALVTGIVSYENYPKGTK